MLGTRLRVIILGAVTAVTASVGAVAIAVPALAASTWRQVSVGYETACGIKTDRTLWCWGANDFRQIGSGGYESAPVTSPDQVAWVRMEDGEAWDQVTVGHIFACGLTTLHRRFCWGGGGGLGSGSYGPTDPGGSEPEWQSLFAGYYHMCGIDTHGLLYCWGDGDEGRLGLGDESWTAVPQRVNTIGWLSVSADAWNTCGITFAHSTYCWGSNLHAQVGTGDESGPDVATPWPIPPNTRFWDAVSVGGTFSCSIRDAGTLYCWGRLPGTKRVRTLPATVDDRTDWTAVSAGMNHVCGLRGSGSLYCAGRNTSGELGLGHTTTLGALNRVGSSSWRSISAGYASTCGIRTNDGLYCWGRNDKGQLGLGDTDDRDSPVRVP